MSRTPSYSPAWKRLAAHSTPIAWRSLPALAAIGIVLPCAAQDGTWWVDDDVCPSTGMGTQQEPLCSIQEAIDLARDGDQILVHPGTYDGDLSFQGKALHLRSLAGPAATTILNVGTPYVAAVRFDQGEGPGSILEGFTVRRGRIVIDGASPMIFRNVIRDNDNFLNGGSGGILVTNGSSPIILENSILNNTAGPTVSAAGGITISSSSAWIEGNVIRGNRVIGDSGSNSAGLGIGLSTVTLVGNLIVENRIFDLVGSYGAGLYAQASTVTMIGNTFSGNVAPDGGFGPGEGGAIYLSNGVQASISDTILWGNVASVGQELFVTPVPSTMVTLSYCTIEGGVPGVAGGGTLHEGPGVLSSDPLFVNPLSSDYHIQTGSPMLEVGDPASSLGTDGDGDPRTLDGDGDRVARRDIGWDERNSATVALSGEGGLGGTVTLKTGGLPGSTYTLGYALGGADIPLPPFGSVLLDPATLVLVTTGAVPGNDVLAVPPAPNLIGTRVRFQALVLQLAAGTGSFTRRIDVTIR